MKAIQATRFGGPDVLKLVDVATPQPRAGEVLVRLEYAGINFADSHFRDGGRGGAAPLVLGVEGAGVVASCAPDVTEFTPGDRVAYWTPLPGSYAEYAAVAAWRLVRIPDGTPSEIACALMVQGLTAQYLTHSTFPIGPGHICLIVAAASGVGQIMTQIAKAKNAHVLAAVGSKAKADVATACGADDIILYREADLSKAARALTGGDGVDVVYDSVGAQTFMQSIASVRVRGMCVVYGMASGAPPAFDTALLNQTGSIYFTRPNIVHHLRSAEEIRTRAKTLLDLHRAGALKVAIDRLYDLSEAVEAHHALHRRTSTGKLLFRL
jgi:NADPH:quinone reductase